MLLPSRRLLRATRDALVGLTCLAAPLSAQAPTISSVSPRTVAPGEVVTIRGTDLKPDTVLSSGPLAWGISIQYREKYGGALRELPATATNSTITFVAASNMAPDNVRLLYTAVGQVASFLPLTAEQRSQSLGPLHIKAKPRLTQNTGVTVSGRGSSFTAVIDGVALLTGRDLLRLPATLTLRTASDPVLVDRTISTVSPTTTLTSATSTTAYSPPSVTFAGAALPVLSAQYPPFNADMVRVSLASLPHNASGFLKVATGEGTDSIKITVAKAPANGRVVQLMSGSEFPVITGQLVRGGIYYLRADNLFIVERTATNSLNVSTPTLRLGGGTMPMPMVNNDPTLGLIEIPTFSGFTGGEMTVSHAGGSLALGAFTVINPPPVLSVTGAVLSPSDIIGGTTANLTVSLSPTPTDFSVAGSLLFDISPSLSASISPMAPVPITSNPMVIPIRTIATGSTATGTLSVSHSTRGSATSGVASLTVRPPRPTAITMVDTVAGGLPVNGTVTFDLPGTATVLLSSSDPSSVSVPASVTRGATSTTFTVTTTAVSSPRVVTIFASVNGTSVSRSLVVRPGRLTAIDPPGPLTGGQSGAVVLAFDIPVANVPVTMTSNDTSLVISSLTATGTSRSVPFTTSPFLSTPRTVTITATAEGIVRSGTVQLTPMQLTAFTAAPTSGAGGSTTAATLRLSRTAIVPQSIELVSSDTTAVRVPIRANVSVGSDVVVVPFSLVSGGTGTRTATVTATLFSRGTPLNSRTITVTVTP